MGKFPGVTTPFVNQGGVAAALTDENLVGEPITINGARLGSASAKATVKGAHLYARETAAPYKARPFMQTAVISDPTNTTNATVDIPDADAVKFKVGDKVTFYDVSGGALSSEQLTLDVIGAAGSGGAGVTLLTFTGETWTTPPEADDLLVVADGTELSQNAIVVLEDVEFDGSTDKPATGYVSGVFNRAKVANLDRFDNTKAQNIQLLNVD